MKYALGATTKGRLYYWLRHLGSTISRYFPNVMKWLKRSGIAFGVLIVTLACDSLR